ncbi:MAG: MmcQ/YjbR family DNA-binding protein [Sediminibacterium sp.]|jgi:predicted DNA-binding protein (MmcQ/YjbR family)|nr:MmcQ/YjbR family DNA-binding protein [Sediminibacterium sp.]MBX9779492.1 MmcQ/YjbR family DNA-binding protein [Chitinophagaceae bacterium]MCA6441034.1 MmcQ/YjbR family DNA-binding protein [Chitinophagaceae bacterium]MCA6446173.1 MmcQ/YjbR family DNA-binding protein [Chitinophagaceae bacterium]
MDIELIREYCLSKPGVEETLPFGPDTLVFKVKNKVFLLISLDAQPLRFNVKCDPTYALELREEYPDTILPGYHMNKKHWNTIVVNGVLSKKLLMKMIDDSYVLVSGVK